MYNRTVLIGHVARKPELKQSDKGTAYCKFSVATNRGYGDKKSTQWNDIVAFGKQAENCCKFLDKGSVCCVEGELVIESFAGKDGAKKKSVSIQASSVIFVSKPHGAVEVPQQPEQQQPNEDNPFVDDAEIPF